jgi:serine/threonine-protein kinase
LDRAIATIREDVANVLGTAAKLVLAMALHQSGNVVEARKVLAAAVTGHDSNPAAVRDQDDWIYHSLHREAESLIMSNIPAIAH